MTPDLVMIDPAIYVARLEELQQKLEQQGKYWRAKGMQDAIDLMYSMVRQKAESQIQQTHIEVEHPEAEGVHA